MKTSRRVVLVAGLAASLPVLAQPGGPPRPPKAALDACAGKVAGAACTFTHEGRAVDGTCFSPSQDKPLACRPAGAPPGRPR